jgi:hypothetical protein
MPCNAMAHSQQVLLRLTQAVVSGFKNGIGTQFLWIEIYRDNHAVMTGIIKSRWGS